MATDHSAEIKEVANAAVSVCGIDPRIQGGIALAGRIGGLITALLTRVAADAAREAENKWVASVKGMTGQIHQLQEQLGEVTADWHDALVVKHASVKLGDEPCGPDSLAASLSRDAGQNGADYLLGWNEAIEAAAKLAETRALVELRPRPTIAELEAILAAPPETIIEIDANGEVHARVPLAKAIRALLRPQGAEKEKQNG